MFKKGDEVKRKDGQAFDSGEMIAVVHDAIGSKVWIAEGIWILDWSIELASVPTPRPHADLAIKFFSDDTVKAQWLHSGIWETDDYPNFAPSSQWREKPTEPAQKEKLIAEMERLQQQTADIKLQIEELD